jgi:hypothetical protein
VTERSSEGQQCDGAVRYSDRMSGPGAGVLAVVALLGGSGCRFGFGTDTDPDAAADAQSDAASDASLVAHFTMEDDPADGALEDSAGTHRAVCGQGVTCGTSVAGKIGMALHLQGLQFYRLPFDATLAADHPFTIAAWIRTDARAKAIVATKRYSLIHNTWGLSLETDGEITFESAVTDSMSMPVSTDLLTGQLIVLGSWTHLALSYDGTVRRGYINGFRVASDALVLLADGGEILIGCDQDDTTRFGFFQGDLDDLRIYDRALGEAEIADLGIP